MVSDFSREYHMIHRRYRFRQQPTPTPPEELVRRTPHTSLYDEITTDYTVTQNDVLLLANGNNITINLPLNHPRLGHKIVIKNIGTGNVTVTTV